MPTLFTVQKDFDSPFMVHDIVEFGRYVYFAGEHYDANPDYAEGAGPGLFRRLIAQSGVPDAVPGSESYRFYALTVFRDNLVALGCLMSDLQALPGGTMTEKLNQNTPPALYVFESSDGENWSNHLIGDIETDIGEVDPESPWNAPGTASSLLRESCMRWVPGYTVSGKEMIRIVTGKHIVQWTGYPPTQVVSLGNFASTIQRAFGRDYLSQYRYNIELAGGTLVLSDMTTTGSASLNVVLPKLSDPAQTFISGGESRLTMTNGALMGVGRGYGRWVLFFSPTAESGQDADANLGCLILPSLPGSPISVDCSKLPKLTKAADDVNTRWYDRVFGGDDPVVVRFAEGAAFCFQKTDMAETDSGLVSVPVFKVPLIEVSPEVAVYSVRHVWQTSDNFVSFQVTAVRHKWSNGSGESPTVTGVEHSWSDGSGGTATVNEARHVWLSMIGRPVTDEVRHKWAALTQTANVAEVRHKWSDGSGEPASVSAVRHSWSDGSGEVSVVSAVRHSWGADVEFTLNPTTTEVRHIWADGLGSGGSAVVVKLTFDAPVSHIRIAPHLLSVDRAKVVEVGVRVDSALPEDLRSSYEPTETLSNVRLPNPGTAVDLMFVLQAGATEDAGELTIVGHREDD